MIKSTISIFLLGILLLACTPSEEIQKVPNPIRVELETTKGNITIELSDKTPLHRDNFIKISENGWLDSMLFHRVLSGFVVQAGEYDSMMYVRTDSADLKLRDYRVPAEFDTSLFHVRGALAAARTGNPDRESSSLSFYFVHAGPRPDSMMTLYEETINKWLQQHYYVNAPENSALKDSMVEADNNENYELLNALAQRVNNDAQSFDFEPYSIPERHREVYQSVGGTPFLDQNYTVFGKILDGLNVVDSIAAVDVNRAGRPDDNVYILSAKVIRDSIIVE